MKWSLHFLPRHHQTATLIDVLSRPVQTKARPILAAALINRPFWNLDSNQNVRAENEANPSSSTLPAMLIEKPANPVR
jgi:hypothetical protein